MIIGYSKRMSEPGLDSSSSVKVQVDGSCE
jgi:hypothetical protein